MGKVRTKRSKQQSEGDTANHFEENTDFIPLDERMEDEQESESKEPAQMTVFYGLLDRQELEYFKSAESTLAANALLAEERQPFIDNVFEEIRGKELKLATHQICSKLMERLIFLASEAQLVAILQAFSGHFNKLAIAKYSSHCLETFLIRIANLLNDYPGHKEGEIETEKILAGALQELLTNASSLAKDKYGCHIMQTVLLFTSGLPINTQLRSKKSGTARKHTDLDSVQGQLRSVPGGLQDYNNALAAELIRDQDATTLRRMALDTLESPLLQVLIRVQAHKSNFTLVDLCIGIGAEGSEVFVNHMLTDATGCHFLEAVILCMPKKKLAGLYNEYFKHQIYKLCQREYGNYCVQALLKSKLGAKTELVGELTPHLIELIKSGRSNIVALMIEHSTPDIRTKLLDTIVETCDPDVFLNSTNMPDALFIESALKHSSRLCTTLIEKLSSGENSEKLQEMATNPVQSHVLESILDPAIDLINRRKFLNLIVPICVNLAVNAYGSHVVDKLAPFCFKLKFIRERIADEFVKNEEKIKHSIYGKLVWKNWNLDKYVHKRFEWWQLIKAQEDELAIKIPAQYKRASGKFKATKPHRTPYDRPKKQDN